MKGKTNNKSIRDTQYVLKHFEQSDKLLKTIIEQVFELANVEEPLVILGSDKNEQFVKVTITDKLNKVVYSETFDTSDDRPYELKVNSSLHTVAGSIIKTLTEKLSPTNSIS